MVPNLDHYYGRAVVSVEPEADAESEADWVIRLEGDILIHNADRKRTAKPEITNMILMGATYDEKQTLLLFGEGALVDEEVVLTPAAYAITDTRYAAEPYFPQRVTPEEEAILPVDPSEDRVVDGPSEEWKEAEKAAQSATEGVEGDPEG